MRRLLPAIALLAAATPTFAATVFRNGDWKLDENLANGVTTCVMYTTREANSIAYQLDVRRVKNAVGPTEVFLKMQHPTRSRGASVWKAVNRGNREFGFAQASSTVSGRNTITTFWNIPTNTTALLTDLENRRELSFVPADTTRNPRLSFSNDGFARVKQEMQTRCVNGSSLINAGFETAFLNDKGRSAVGVSPETVVELRTLLVAGVEAYSRQGANSTALATLGQRFAAPLNEVTTLNNTIERLGRRDIPATQTSQAANDQTEVNARQAIAQSNNAIPAQVAAVTGAEQVLARTQAAITPHQANHDRLAQSNSAAQSQVDNNANRLAAIESDRNRITSELRNLNFQAQQASDAAAAAERSIPDARRDLRRAERAFDEFNAEREVRLRLREDRASMSAFAELPDARRRHARLEEEVPMARQARDEQQGEVNLCANTGADCGAERAALLAANQLLERTKDEEKDAERRLNQLQNTVRSAEQRITSEVQSIQNALANDVNSANAQLNGLESSIVNNQRRANEIYSFQMPALNDQMAALDREEPLVADALDRATPEANRTADELSAFEARVGWHAKIEARYNARTVLDARNSELSATRSALANAEGLAARTVSERARLAGILADQQARLAQSQTRLQVVIASLVPYEQEKARLENVGSTVAGEIEGLSQQFDNLLPN